MRPSRRSCDRCYSIKEKCQPGNKNGTCSRCERLRHECTTARPMRRVGRRPRNAVLTLAQRIQTSNQHIETSTTTHALLAFMTMNLPIEPGLALNGIQDLLPREAEIIEFLLDKTQFIKSFVIGPSFAEDMRRSLQSRLFASPSLLIDGFLACSGEFAQRCGRINLEDDFNITKCTKALQKFRNFQPRNVLDAPTFLSLGTSILTYDNLAAMNTGSLICRYTLSQIKPWYSELKSMPDLDFELNCLVFLDLVHCLLHRELPIIKPEIRDFEVIDRYIGLCYTFMPYLYEICVLSRQINPSQSETERSSRELELVGAEQNRVSIRNIQAQVSNWEPTPPNDFSAKYTTEEVIILSAQAFIYRQMALLMLHRLLYPSRGGDTAAQIHADAILSQTRICYQSCGNYPFKNGLPLFIAALEAVLPETREEFIDIILETGDDSIHYQRVYRLQKALRYVWGERDSDRPIYWFECALKVPGFVSIYP